MIVMTERFRPREEEVAAKVMDGEAILINLSNGIYYSMDKVGGFVWEMVESRQSVEEMVTGIVARYEVSREQAEADLALLMEELVQENLIAASEDGAAGIATTEVPDQKMPYDAPKLNIYRDMGDLLALDPPTPGLQDIAWKDGEDDGAKKS
jgi:hypothetical protein